MGLENRIPGQPVLSSLSGLSWVTILTSVPLLLPLCPCLGILSFWFWLLLILLFKHFVHLLLFCCFLFFVSSISFSIFNYIFINLECMYLHMHMLCMYCTHAHIMICVWKSGLRGNQGISSTTWIPGVELRSSGLAATSVRC